MNAKKNTWLALLAGACMGLCGAAEPAPIVAIGFDEGKGSFSDTSAGAPRSAELTPSAKWAKGPFGTALAVGEKGAAARLGAFPELNGDAPFTVFMRFRRTGPASDVHSCILSTTDWVNGGLLFYTHGDGLCVRCRAGRNGPENGITAFAKIPQDRWCSVAFVYGNGVCRVYADGKRTCEQKWPHPFRAKEWELGKWNSASFGGFIDDFRVWKAALDDKQIAALADDSRYAEVEGYQDDGTGGIGKATILPQHLAGGKSVATFENAAVSLAFDAAGCVSSLREKNGGRELVADAVPFVTLARKDGGLLVPRTFEKRGADRLAWCFPFDLGEVELRVEPFDGGWCFRVTGCTVKDVGRVEIGCVKPACTKYLGYFVNALGDDASVVCVRSGDVQGEPKLKDLRLFVAVDAPFEAKGRTAYLAAGPRAGIIAQLRAMTIAAGVPRSDCGGPWSMGSEPSRWSYVFSPIRNGDVDHWIQLTKRAGFSHIHIDSSWTHCLGQCPVNPGAFPDGLDGMARAARRVHEAGLHVGMHTLTACINPRDPWITPSCSEDLVADATYTLAAPLAPDAAEMLVEEMPISRHATVFTYSSNGNVFRFGNELIQYSGIERDKKPYRFTGIKRGCFGTKKGGTIPAGAKVDYLHQRYIAFYPKPDSKLADALADRLAEVYNKCNLDELYFDGSEGMGTRYGIDVLRHKIYSRLKHNNGHAPSVEASCQGANNWWFQTRTATTDHGVYGVKRFHDFHINWGVKQGRTMNFLEPQMGWWQPRTDVPKARGHFLDEMEYFAGKNAGHDAAMSLQGLGARPLPIGVRRQLTILGWYEYPRLARAFADDARERLAGERTEARLRQDDDGVWQLEDVEEFKQRFGFDWTRRTTFASETERPAALRVEALYGAAAPASGVPLLKVDEFAEMKTDAADGVQVAFTPAADGEKGAAFRLSATNKNAKKQNGAWARALRKYAFPGLNAGGKRIAYGAWVKGDGSGALLNLQLVGYGEYVGGVSDHYVRLDFTGWKYVAFLLRERDAGEFWKYSWPYGGGYAACYRNMIPTEHIESFAAYLNDVPAGQTATVEIGAVEALEQKPLAPLADAAVVVNGKRFALPFPLVSGEYAELDGGRWTRYTALGKALESVEAEEAPVLAAGDNKVELAAADGARAEVTLFALSNRRAAFKDDLDDAQLKQMRYESVMPFVYAPAKGLLPPAVIPVRDGGEARLEIEIAGPARNPSFTFPTFFGFSSKTYTFPATIAADEKLVCTDGAAWRVVKHADGKEVAKGTLEEAMPLLTKPTAVAFAAELDADASCEVDLLKNYAR